MDTSSVDKQHYPNEVVARLRDLISCLVPDWLPSKRVLISLILVAALGYLSIVIISATSAAPGIAASAVSLVMVPIGWTGRIAQAMVARRFRDVLYELETTALGDLKVEIQKRTQGLHRSSEAEIVLLLLLTISFLLTDIGLSIAFGSFGLMALALIFGVVAVVSAHLVFLRRLRELGQWINGVICARCGYDIHATPNRCPECGTLTPPSVNA